MGIKSIVLTLPLLVLGLASHANAEALVCKQLFDSAANIAKAQIISDALAEYHPLHFRDNYLGMQRHDLNIEQVLNLVEASPKFESTEVLVQKVKSFIGLQKYSNHEVTREAAVDLAILQATYGGDTVQIVRDVVIIEKSLMGPAHADAQRLLPEFNKVLPHLEFALRNEMTGKEVAELTEQTSEAIRFVGNSQLLKDLFDTANERGLDLKGFARLRYQVVRRANQGKVIETMGRRSGPSGDFVPYNRVHFPTNAELLK